MSVCSMATLWSINDKMISSSNLRRSASRSVVEQGLSARKVQNPPSANPLIARRLKSILLQKRDVFVLVLDILASNVSTLLTAPPRVTPLLRVVTLFSMFFYCWFSMRNLSHKFSFKYEWTI
ncbi:uncharacterized protein LOC120353019 [Nilaparvata lugens]|uniref:uncharacterized protein LOC120353019 n=1 Tax=Nilaparvata lugens TaxID=108931 RepID=UPI00193D3629|nr:uncharacterized protein LOC120353019 [Nilaparvata lugens]